MNIRKITAILIAVMLIVFLFTACSADSITLNEPKYNGEAANGKPEFKLSWSQVADTENYQLVFFAEGDGFAVRSTKSVFGTTEADIIFLQGVYTDTVRYRVKVGPYPSVGEESPFYSNIYEIDFIDGEYTVTETTADFDSEITKADAGTTIVSDAPTVAETEGKEANHDYPESFMDFMEAEEYSDLSTDDIAEVSVIVKDDIKNEPTQTVTDETTIKKLASALDYMTVTDKADNNTGSRNTYYSYTFYNAEGKRMFSFIVQDGYLVTNFGRYNVDGLPMLLDNSGIKLEDDWQEYWAEYNEKAAEYASSFEGTLPVSVLQACGYSTNELSETNPEEVTSITCYVDGNDNAGKLYTTSPDEISSILEAVKNISATSVNSNPQGQTWHLSFTFNVPGQNFSSTAGLEFLGDCIKIGNTYYNTSGLEDLFSSSKTEVFRYISNHAKQSKVDPVY